MERNVLIFMRSAYSQYYYFRDIGLEKVHHVAASWEDDRDLKTLTSRKENRDIKRNGAQERLTHIYLATEMYLRLDGIRSYNSSPLPAKCLNQSTAATMNLQYILCYDRNSTNEQ